MDQLVMSLFLYIVIIFSATLHEFGHGFVAYKLGDSTAKDQGRLTLNPIAHIDLLGTVIIPLLLLLTSGFFIGWAKPVPYNPYNLRDKKYGSLKVGIAGPLSNLLIAVILGLFLRVAYSGILGVDIASGLFLEFISLIVYVNIFLAVFNLIPVPPLDGSKVLMDLFPFVARFFLQIEFWGIFLALFLSYYILSPIAGFIFGIIAGGRPGL